MTTVTREREDLMQQLRALLSAELAACFTGSPMEQLRVAVRECAAQAEIYRKLGLIDESLEPRGHGKAA